MKHKVLSALLMVRLFLVLSLALIAVQMTGGISYASPIPASPISQSATSIQPFLCTNVVVDQYCNIRVVLLIDDTGSMRTNDPQNIRNQASKNLVDILAKEYYQPAVDAHASDPNVVLPDVEVAVIHFSHCISTDPKYNCSTDVKFNSGWRPITQQDQINNDIDWSTRPAGFYNVQQYTHFIEPFQAAAALFDQPAAVSAVNCTKRFMLLLTDGTPEDVAGRLHGSDLANEMNQVGDAVKGFIAQPNSHIYITAFKISKNYWTSEVEPYWKQIAGVATVADVSNVILEDSLDAVASHMESIATFSIIGTQSSRIDPEPDNPRLYKVNVLPHTSSLRVSYFKLDPKASLSLTDSQGNILVPNNDTVVQTGKGTSIEVWTLKNPSPGTYQILSLSPDGIITATPRLDVNAQLDAPTADAPLLQFTPGLIRFDLVDSQGQPVLPNDFASGYTLSVTSALVQGDATIPLTLIQDGAAYQTNWMPLSTTPGSVTVSVDLTDASHVLLLKCQGSIGDFSVDPVTVKIAPPTACTDVNVSVAIPVQVVNERTGKAAGIGLPIQWQVNSVTSSSGQKVNSLIKPVDVKTGQYELSLTPFAHENINSHIAASVSADGRNIPFYDDNITISVCPQIPPAPSCNLNDLWNYLLWLAVLLLAIVLLIRLLLGSWEGKYIIPSWLLGLLLILLLLLWFFWCRTIPFWALLLLLLILLIIFLLIRIITHNKNWRISFWFWMLLIILILLILFWLIYFSSLWIFLLLMLLVLFIILLITWLLRK